MGKMKTRFAGKLRKPDMLIGKRQTIVDKEEKPTQKPGAKNKTYFDVQAIVEGDGLVRYTTGAVLLTNELRKWDLPARDKVIQKDWRGLYFEAASIRSKRKRRWQEKNTVSTIDILTNLIFLRLCTQNSLKIATRSASCV